SSTVRNMSRFFSGFFWKHPATINFDYIFRLDEGIKFWCKLNYDPFILMQQLNKKYAFSQLCNDAHRVTKGLFSHIQHFFNQNPSYVTQDNNLDLFTNPDGQSWNMKMVYNNFEISHRSVWESESYTKFFDYLDKLGG
ncbi:nucleotide-diphospho-sugar transferase, partial [Meredithblackwellia eburnea MCA 4105]